jgi:hypothetical protein
MQSEKEFESLLDRALSSYCDALPSAALEQRVLNRIRATNHQRRSFTRWPWAAALVVSVLALIAVTVRLQHRPVTHSEKPVSNPETISRRASSETKPGPSAAYRRFLHIPAAAEPSVRRLATARGLPKQEQFPRPSPLSDEERLLLAFVKRDPSGAVRAFADLEKRAGDPLEIQAVEIKPLQADGER